MSYHKRVSLIERTVEWCWITVETIAVLLTVAALYGLVNIYG